MKTLVDTNVLLDIITQDRKWFSWAETAIRAAADHSTLAINPIIFAEVSMKFDRIEDADKRARRFCARATALRGRISRWKGLPRF